VAVVKGRSTIFGGHPDARHLLEWLDGADSAGGHIGEHLATCERCADQLESLAGDSDDDPAWADDGELNEAIRELFAPPPDLVERLKQTITDRERADRELSLFGELFRLPGDVADALFGPGTARHTERGRIDPERGEAEP
jgi:hypothetical protein